MKELVLTIKNKQCSTARIFGFLSFTAAVLMILPFVNENPLTGIWALAFLGIFLSVAFFIVSLVFRGRARKMEKLKSGEKLLVHLELDSEMIKNYAETLRTDGKEKSKAIMWVIGILFLIVTTIFLFFLEDDERLGFIAIIGSVVIVVFAASRFFPWYYYHRNLKGDGQILIGEKYAYFNGYLHNWDYPLSGLTRVKAIKKPFHGIYLSYYYTDRTWQHSHEIKFPLPKNFDPKPIVERLRSSNKK